MSNTNVVVISDFADDYYHGVMKGVVLSRSPNSNIVDMHVADRFEPISVAWTLLNSIEFFPKNSVFLIVVDPGVGSSRKPLLVYTKSHYFILPDNGIINPIIDEESKIIKIESIKPKSNTFHGRDLFAPIAGQIAQDLMNDKTVDLDKYGSETDSIGIRFEIHPTSEKNGLITYIDQFGNIITNLEIQNKGFGDTIYIEINKKELSLKLFENFDQSGNENLFLIIGSCGTLEIVKNQGSANDELKLNVGDRITIDS